MLATLVFAAAPTSAFISGPAVPLEEVARTADLVCKATVIADRPVTDSWFEPIPSPYFDDQDAQFWFVGIGNGHLPGLGARKRLASAQADVATQELLQVATDGVTPDIRALAIIYSGIQQTTYAPPPH